MRARKEVVAVFARMGDPLYQPARARLIWASQTAQAVHDLGLDCVLVGSAHRLPVRVDGPVGVQALKRLVSGMYNVAADFKIMPLYPPRPDPANPLPYGRHEAEELFPQYVLPYVDVVHTRDPRGVVHCIRTKIPVIYEDHNEDYHLSVDPVQMGVNEPVVRAVVAITQAVADRLVLCGVNRSKIIVLDSGVNERALRRFPARAQAWRDSLLRAMRRERLAVYTGGMQVERGIAHILNAASEMPEVLFAMAGGNRRDIEFWMEKAVALNLTNVRFLDYLPQDQVIELQQAADVVLMTREDGPRCTISSPLKLFEYLASGTPVVAVRAGLAGELDLDGCAINWYDPANPDELVDVIRKTLKKFPRSVSGYQQNMMCSSAYTWLERQRKIFEFADLGHMIDN